MEANELDTVLRNAAGLLRHAHQANSPIKPTDFYNEGWLTALTLSVAAKNVDLLPFRFAPDARWWSEALLRSPFNPRKRGDGHGEGLTNADALVGHFDCRGATKRGVQIRSDATQLIVIEAKLNARLSAKTANAKNFDQAARSVACMACELNLARVDLSRCTSLAFYVLAPDASLKLHRKLVSRDSIQAKVRARIKDYEEPWQTELNRWFDGPFLNLLNRVTLDCVSWESIIARAGELAPEQAGMLSVFYRECRRLN